VSSAPSVPIIVSTADFAVTVTPSPLTVIAGQPAVLAVATQSFLGYSSTITLTCGGTMPPGMSCNIVAVSPGFASSSLMLTPAMGTTLTHPITLTTTGLPSGATASFSPAATLTLGNAATAVTLSIQTATSQTAHNEQPILGHSFAPVSLGFLLLPLLGFKAARRRLRQSLPLMLLVVGLSLGTVLGISGLGRQQCNYITKSAYAARMPIGEVADGQRKTQGD
jgi:hypothetical protein